MPRLDQVGVVQPRRDITPLAQRGYIQAALLQRQIGYGGGATGESDPKALIPIEDFIGYVESVEQTFSDDTPTDIVTRIRVQYYSGLAFERLIPEANTHDIVPTYSPYAPVVIVPRTLGPLRHADPEAYEHLTARADENALGDNPSPYIVLDNGDEIDVGHLLLGLDALIHPRTSEPYTSYDVPNIDPSSWVADIGIASVWMTQHEESEEPPDDAPRQLDAPDLDAYYQMSAPEQDLLGDVDSFGLHQEGFASGSQPLSQVLRSYYLGQDGAAAGVTRRWQRFCAGNSLRFTRAGSTITWAPDLQQTLVARVDRFNDLYAAGALGSIGGMVFGPDRRSWPHTPAVVRRFLDWVKGHLEAELAR